MNSLNQTPENKTANKTDIEPDEIFHLSVPGNFLPAAADLPDRVNDLPAFYYWKDAIVVGSYVHPAGRFSLDITRDRLDGFVANFNRMRDNGVAVPILMDHTATAVSTLGWIVDVKRQGDQLLELHQFLGESARDIGLRNKVSLGIDPHFVDGKGNQYGEAIVHSAVTPLPVVPDQGDFIAAERVELSLCAAEPVEPKAKIAGEPASPGAFTSDSPVDLHNALRQVVSMKRDLALSRGALVPAVATELFDLLVGSANLLTLSRTSNGIPIAMAVFDALAKNHPVSLGETTGLQVLSRSIPGDDGSLDDLRQRMIALASGGK
jgi:hypothetical protein